MKIFTVQCSVFFNVRMTASHQRQKLMFFSHINNVMDTWIVLYYISENLSLRGMGSYGSIGNSSPSGGGSRESDEEERDSIRTPLVLAKGKRAVRRQPASQVNRLFPTLHNLI